METNNNPHHCRAEVSQFLTRENKEEGSVDAIGKSKQITSFISPLQLIIK